MSSLVKVNYQSPARRFWENDLSLWCPPSACRFELSISSLLWRQEAPLVLGPFIGWLGQQLAVEDSNL